MKKIYLLMLLALSAFTAAFSQDQNQWTWVSGTNFINDIGRFGTKGVASTLNSPHSRESAVSWTDASGNLLHFGGIGFTGSFSFLHIVFLFQTHKITLI